MLNWTDWRYDNASSSTSYRSRLYFFIFRLFSPHADFSDRDDFYRQVGRLPLIPGKSLLSEAACPDLIQQYRNMLLKQQGMPDQDDMLRHPRTVELDSMFQLVLNCQQRSQFLADIRVRKNLPSDNKVEDIEVPSPGVPFNYLGIPVDDTSNKHADDIVEEYDWLRKLLSDRSSA